MGTARRFNDTLRNELRIYAAWLPVTNTFKLGDFGLISDGVLVKVGNIQDDFGVAFSSAPGPESKLDFSSKGTRVIRAVGNATVDVLPDQDVEAKITIQFNSQNSFLAKANLSVVEMQNIRAVAGKLGSTPGWERKFRVISAIYIGRQCVIVSSKAADSKLELSGKAKGLKQFDLGSIGTEVQVSASEKIGLELIGKTGVVGLALFKLNWLTGAPKILREANDVTVETHDNWPMDLSDDV